MIYIANVEVYDYFEDETTTNKVILEAKNWSEAINKLVNYFGNYFGKNEIKAIKSFEPIDDNFVYIDNITEDHIRRQILNEFQF